MYFSKGLPCGKLISWALMLIALASFAKSSQDAPAKTKRSREAVTRTKPGLLADFQAKGLVWGSPVYIRAFKKEKILEVWVQKNQRFQLFASYEICYFSGKLGPKRREGDLQVPEGFYEFGPQAMVPWSDFHLSFNIGYPNRYDRAHGRTGSYIMIHGNCVSTGCLAMTDPIIEKIYVLVEAAFLAGQKKISVHIFPFVMTDESLAKFKDHAAFPFWKNLQQGFQKFQATALPPKVSVKNGRYHFP